MLTTMLNDLYYLNREMNRMFNSQSQGRYYSWPEANVYENSDEYVITAKVPGLKKEDISITLKDNSLKISGESKKEKKEKANEHLSERFYGKFEKSFMLNEKVDSGKIDAEMKNGLLIIKLAKSPETKPKSIAIK